MIKTIYRSTLLALLFATPLLSISAQSTTISVPLEVSTTQAEFLGHTKPVRNMVEIRKTTPDKRKQVKRNNAVPKNFVGRGRPTQFNPDAKPQGPDPTRQSVHSRLDLNIEPTINITGITAGPPNDPSGDVGRDHYVQAINATTIAVYDKQGELLTTFAANAIWSQVNRTSAGDPIVLYDQEVERWIITEFPRGNELLVAISDDHDPLGSYTAYNFGTPQFPDYPKYGIWTNAYSVTTNESGAGQHVSYFINRDQLLAGEPTVDIQRITFAGESGAPGFFVPSAVDWTGRQRPAQDKPILLSLQDDAWGSSDTDNVLLHTIEIDWDNPSNTTVNTTTIPTSPYDSNPCSINVGGQFPCMPQPGNGGALDGIPFLIMFQPHYRNFGTHESIVYNFITDVSGGDNLSGIRWVELRRTSVDEEWMLYQEGTYAPEDGLDRYMGSICMDANGNMALAYIVSSETEFAGVRFTGRRASDPLGEMSVVEYVAAVGDGSINSNSRFGDYSHMTIDPTDDRSFWFTAEYAGGTPGSTLTRIISYNLGRDTVDLAAAALVEPTSSAELGASETIIASFVNVGIDTISSFSVGYQVDDRTRVLEVVDFELSPDSFYTHTFDITADFDVIGDYDVKIFTSLLEDSAPLNDTISVFLRKLGQNDAALVSALNTEPVLCGDSTSINLTLRNIGARPISTVEIEQMVNGIVTGTVTWEGDLATGESESVLIPLTDLERGTSGVDFTIISVNGTDDDREDNNQASVEVTAITTGADYLLQIQFDEFPDETTWTLLDENDNVFYEGGPYDDSFENEIFSQVICLDSTACYIFVINDSYGDGMCCQYGEGFSLITDMNGNVVMSLDGEFNSSAEQDFCGVFECKLIADAFPGTISEPGASDGTLFINTQNGIGEVQISIDGGNTFSTRVLYSNLSEDTYDIVVEDAAGCRVEFSIDLLACKLQADINVTGESAVDADDGSIIVDIIDGFPPYEYSINGGFTFQDLGEFTDLGSGDYDLVVRDSLGCELESTVELDISVSTRQLTAGVDVEVFPNPTADIVRMSISGAEHPSSILPLTIYSAAGTPIMISNLTLYDGVYTGQLSLMNYPAGTYYVVVDEAKVKILQAIVKE